MYALIESVSLSDAAAALFNVIRENDDLITSSIHCFAYRHKKQQHTAYNQLIWVTHKIMLCLQRLQREHLTKLLLIKRLNCVAAATT